MKPSVLIITGHGLNCEAESKAAWEMAGADTSLVHLNDLLETPALLNDHHALMFIGGFSFGDHLVGSGHVMALRIRQRIQDHLKTFIDKGRLILGVCNGFQVMTRMGLLPAIGNDYSTQTITIAHNNCGTFQNFWVRLIFEADSPCIFTRGLQFMDIPIRHGEGKIFTSDARILGEIEKHKMVPCRYADPEKGIATMKFPYNPNGSMNAIAGLCDPTGRIFGLMPHPEAYIFPENNPLWPRKKIEGTLPSKGEGLKIFQNAVEHLQKHHRPIGV